MLRIMDVASALRRERETAEAQLDLATAKQRLRERLLATAEAGGEKVTPAEVDAAIEHYFAQQHRYADPPGGWKSFWAHLWVMRLGCLSLLVMVGALVLGILALTGAFSSAPKTEPKVLPRQTPPPVEAPKVPGPGTAPPTPVPSPSATDALAVAWAKFERTAAAAASLASDDEARQRVRRESERGAAAYQAADRRRLEAAQVDLDLLVARLDQEYELTIVSRAGEKSGIDRLFDGKLSGYYVFVEALTPDGRALPQSIKNSETGRTETVKVWGEQVSTAVWERIVADKQADGVLDDTIVARKVRGAFAEVMVMLDENGKLMRRGRQITKW
ncbi:MAG: DUF6384 family protein [Planctomycetes bacterium]|nr:DUF6384 family protein [Planctomycetota bacterium]